DAVAGLFPSVVTFNSSSSNAVDTARNSVFVGDGTSLQTGDAITYDSNGRTPVGGLTSLSGTPYYLNVVKTVDTANDTIFVGLNAGLVSAGLLNVGLATGDGVVYDAMGNTAISGLTNGTQYFARVGANG